MECERTTGSSYHGGAGARRPGGDRDSTLAGVGSARRRSLARSASRSIRSAGICVSRSRRASGATGCAAADRRSPRRGPTL